MKSEIIGVSQNIQKIRDLIDQVADTGLNTVICGETGVGKELVVQCLYQKSDRVGKPFVKVNCAALPDSLLESEMFGYEQGAFTGAERRKRGKFEQAHGGVLFLDEIGDMSLPLQSKLLHVLQGGEFTPLGSEKSVKSDTWVIAATNHELEEEMRNGGFREDLYYRLSTIKIYLAPLRDRPEDIPHLINHYIEQYTRQFNTKNISIPSQSAIEKLSGYHWPGNVRELQNVLKRIMILGSGEENMEELLGSASPPKAGNSVRTSGREFSMPMDLLGIDGPNSSDLASLSLKEVKRKALDRVEKEVISYVLQKTGWNRSKATKILNISYKTLLYKIKDLNIKPPPSSTD
ncbi:MAG: sigma-54-dependent Fis family transcriptional regulator [Desulfobacterales bacterium]|nr:MAG: sigma-54-dependent Fis family transcriptional regulator [Desulfobacterales bacterium]